MGNQSSANSDVSSRLKTPKFGMHLEREQKALNKVKNIHNDETERDSAHHSAHSKLLVHQLFDEIGQDMEKNVVDPIKHWSGFRMIQECSKPQAHIDSDDDEDDPDIQVPAPGPQKKKNPQHPSWKPKPKTAKERARDMLRDIHPEYDPDDIDP